MKTPASVWRPSGRRYDPHPPADIAGFVRPYMEATFPSLAGGPIDHAWPVRAR